MCKTVSPSALRKTREGNGDVRAHETTKTKKARYEAPRLVSALLLVPNFIPILVSEKLWTEPTRNENLNDICRGQPSEKMKSANSPAVTASSSWLIRGLVYQEKLIIM